MLNGATGLTVPPGRPAAMGSAIVELLNDRDLATKLGAAGRRHVYPRYDSSRLVNDVRDLYMRELALRGRAVPPVEVHA